MHRLTPQIARMLANSALHTRRLVFNSLEMLADSPAGANTCTIGVSLYRETWKLPTIEDAGLGLRDSAVQLAGRPPMTTQQSGSTMRFEPVLLAYEEQMVERVDIPAAVKIEWNPLVAEALQQDFCLLARYTELTRMSASAGFLLARAILLRRADFNIEDGGWVRFSVDEIKQYLPPTRVQNKNFSTYREQVLNPALKALRRQAGWEIDLKRDAQKRRKGGPITVIRLRVTIHGKT